MTATTITNDPELMTPAEVAALFGVGAKTASRWARSGKLPFVRTLGGHFRFRRADVLAFLFEGTEVGQASGAAQSR